MPREKRNKNQPRQLATFPVPPALWAEARAAAWAEKRFIAEVLRDFLEKYIARAREKYNNGEPFESLPDRS